jgi:hypothetical protein
MDISNNKKTQKMKDLKTLTNEVKDLNCPKETVFNLINSFVNGLITEYQYNWLSSELIKNCIISNIEIENIYQNK